MTIADVTNNAFFARFEASIDRVHRLHPEMPRDAVVRVRLLYHTLRTLFDQLETFFAEQGVSTAAWGVLMMTYAMPEGRVNPSSLSESLGQSRTHMTRVADELVAKGYMARATGADDRRRIDLQLTAEGRRFITRVLPRAWREYKRCLGVFDAAEAQTFERLLRKLLGHLTSGAVAPARSDESALAAPVAKRAASKGRKA